MSYVNVNQTWTPQQKMAAMMRGQLQSPGFQGMPAGGMFGGGNVDLYGNQQRAAQQAYEATLPGGSAAAYDKMRADQRMSDLYGMDVTNDSLVGQEWRYNPATGQAGMQAAPNRGVDLNALRASGHVGGPVVGGAERYMQRTNPILHPGLSQSAFQPLASEMNPNSTMFARLNQQQSPLLNKLLQ